MIKTELTKDERTRLRQSPDELRLILKALEELQDAQQIRVLTCPIDAQQLIIERAKLEGGLSLINGLKKLLKEPVA